LETQARALDQRILEFIRGVPRDGAFEALALDLFAYQYAANAPYRALCERMGRTPARVRVWTEIPALSAASFADARIACFPPDRAVLRFVSSGTTRVSMRPSMHELEDPALYDASLTTHFRHCVMPDRETMTMAMLSPSFEEAEHSSLAYMLARIFTRYAREGGFYIRNGQLDMDALVSMLRAHDDQPILVFGTAFAFVHFMEACEAAKERFELPSGSRIVETGGFKGKSRTIERTEFYDALCALFGVPSSSCISEYGMCELASQWYDAGLRDAWEGRTPRTGVKIGPRWTRFVVVDPVTTEPVAAGEEGLLQVLDLSNRGSVAAVLTADVVTSCGDGFIYRGRSPAAPPKGCSITIDSMLRSNA
jgi:hypothetical protein